VLSPSLVFRESVNVLFTGTEEIQKVHAHVFAGLAHTQENEVFFNSFRCRETFDDGTTESGECLYCMLGIIVVPRNTIML
jgi:hypothetical protein